MRFRPSDCLEAIQDKPQLCAKKNCALSRLGRRPPPCQFTFDLIACPDYHQDERLGMRQLIYGLILGAASMYMYERLDPPAILAYLNAATESAVQSTSGYGGTHRKQ